jgi:DNA-directed RNA polymerase subunit RPC12/RpoP
MPGTEYECGVCRHRFRPPEGQVLDARTLMCPACGSIDLGVVDIERPRPPVVRAHEGAPAGDWLVPHKTNVS